MLTFVFGDCAEKRRYFESKEIYIDAAEVLYCTDRKGKSVLVAGTRPFAFVTAEDYVAYSRALCGDKTPPAKLLSFVGYRGCLDSRLAKLDAFEYRKVLIAAKYNAEAKTLYINFDDVKYTRHNAALLRRFVADLKKFDLVILCSDVRFFARNSVAGVVTDGEYKAFPIVEVKRVGKAAERRILLGASATNKDNKDNADERAGVREEIAPVPKEAQAV